MKKTIFVLLATLIVSQNSVAFAQTENPYDYYFEGMGEPQLTEKELKALDIAEKWQKGQVKEPIVQGRDGLIEFIYGLSQPSVITAVFQITDIQFEAGEEITGVNIGDTARWNIEPAISGSTRGSIQHLLIKPTDTNLNTSLVVTTNKRTYHIQLKSTTSKYYPRVSFHYPESAMAKFNNLQKFQVEQKQKTQLSTGEYLGDLNFEYTISGRASWKPLRVYNDGIKTIIQLPHDVKHKEIPTLIVLSDGQEALVNYRFQDDRFIVDSLFEEAILILGVGSKQEKVKIKQK